MINIAWTVNLNLCVQLMFCVCCDNLSLSADLLESIQREIY